MNFNKIYQDLIFGNTKLAMVGLGYVGMPIAVEFAKHVKVVGFDINEHRIQEYHGNHLLYPTDILFRTLQLLHWQ